MPVTAAQLKSLAQSAGFELAGITPAIPSPDFARYQTWVSRGHAGKMGYLTDRRSDVRSDPRNLLPCAKSILCLGKLYNTDHPFSTDGNPTEPWISRYAWGEDYHSVLRAKMLEIIGNAHLFGEFEYKICVDTAPLLERSYARAAGLGWIGKNTCLINQQQGSWFFLCEILLSLDLEPDSPPPDRCGTCTHCIDACPTQAILPGGEIDSRLCISYLTIELKGPIPEQLRGGVGRNLFGCDICQDVCPWNSRAPVTTESAFEPKLPHPDPLKFSYLSADEFRLTKSESPTSRAKYTGFLRNVALAMGNLKREEFRAPLEHLTQSGDEIIAEQAVWSLRQLDRDATGRL